MGAVILSKKVISSDGQDTMSCVMMVLMSLELFSEELYAFRLQLSPYRDTIDMFLQYFSYAPKMVVYGADVFVLYCFCRNKGLVSVFDRIISQVGDAYFSA